ncbi:hypothetical protein GP486_000647 [Trichoglossum hirsutum]|uniref:GET complex subunit GET2 n=1 Tax=Trichoglossum hirsutum TaxID=265104 RepID=A0A9P8LID7_9PEZI|nr:hypothetical protein GP486_000647 [Trichoglossum hirsutum]
METPPTPSPAPHEARARKERLGAKIKARGAARLERITNMKEPMKEIPKPSDLSNPPASSEDLKTPADRPPSADEAATRNSTSDPDEIDISQHYYTPGTGSHTRQPPPSSQQQQPQLPDDQLLRLMLSLSGEQGQPGTNEQQNPFAPGPMDTNIGNEDPLMRALRGILGEPHGARLNGGSTSDGTLPQEDAQQNGDDTHRNIWKAVHAVFALTLAIYIVVTTSFAGTRTARRQEPPPSHVAPRASGTNFFWLFATVELLLQSTRFFLEKGRAPRDSLLGNIAQYLPPPFAGYLVVLARYSVIYKMIVQDGMLILFVLGCTAWWNGGATA